jgi:hypothetical protein
VIWGLGGGNSIGCPPIARFGTPEQRRRWLPEVAKGDIRFCLGITEPDGEKRLSYFIVEMTDELTWCCSWIGCREYSDDSEARRRSLCCQRIEEVDHEWHLG